MIASKDISVIIQGKIDKSTTHKCIESINKYLPEAEVILSTWQNEDISSLKCDKIILNKDPGAAFYDINKKLYYNINRQIYSTQKGLELASKKYTLKLRSDIILTGNSFLKYFNKYDIRDKNYSIAKHKILVSSLFTIIAEYGVGQEKGKKHRTPYHISD